MTQLNTFLPTSMTPWGQLTLPLHKPLPLLNRNSERRHPTNTGRTGAVSYVLERITLYSQECKFWRFFLLFFLLIFLQIMVMCMGMRDILNYFHPMHDIATLRGQIKMGNACFFNSSTRKNLVLHI